MNDNIKLDEKLSVADLRMYNEKEEKSYTSLSKVIIARDINTSIDVFDSFEYPVYFEINGNLVPACTMANNNLEQGELFCVVENDLDMSEDIIEYMMDSKDFYFHRLKYAKERFNLYAKNNISSYTLPMLLKYKKIVQKDLAKYPEFESKVTIERQNLINERKKLNNNSYKKTTNQY